MPIRVEIFGATGVAIGVVAQPGRLRDVLESGLDLSVEGAVWHPLDGSAPSPSRGLTIAEDDIMLAVADQIEDIPVHAQWHDISLDVGPYRVSGQMPTMPGFDPGRALARPTGEFVLLRDVGISLVGDADGPSVVQAAAFVNRYVVDRVAADLMLGFYFPGAEMVLTGGHEKTAAGVAPAAGEPGPTGTVTNPVDVVAPAEAGTPPASSAPPAR